MHRSVGEMVGSSLGPYKILEPLGSGGMGDVYLAEDTRLGRKVAIKVLPEEFAADPERLARFEQEAKAAAALNHPHIAAVFDVGFQEGLADDTAATNPNLEASAIPSSGVHFIVQEYLEGDTLRAPLDKGALPIAKALTLGREIAAALGAAHAAGIVHRDLKPENVFITLDGHAKVLDFGLAKLTEAAMPASRMSMSPTMLGTVAGQVMGTAGYMAPEQVEGLEDIDHRADLFAFGCVLYEMVGGKRAFTGATVLDTLHAIARTDPQPVHEIKSGLPAELERILNKCLDKDPSARYQHADDLTVDLKNLAAAVESGTAAMSASGAATSTASRGNRIGLVPAALVATVLVAIAAAGGVIGGRMLPGTPEPPMMIFDIKLPEDARIGPAAGRNTVAIAPDGNTIVYTAVDNTGTQWLFRRRIDDPVSERISGSEGARPPEFSPNGQWLTFYANGQINKLPLAGGTALSLASSTFNQTPAWGDDNNIYFVDEVTIWRVNSAGGAPEEVYTVGDGEWLGRRLQVLPGSRGLLAEVGTAERLVAAVDLESGELHPMGISGARPTYTPAGYVLYADDGMLWALPFDANTLQPTGDQQLVTQGVLTSRNGQQARFAVSDDNKLIYGPSEGSDRMGDALVWLDAADGTEVQRSPASDGVIRAARVEPDGRRVIVVVQRGDGSQALDLYDPVQQAFQQFVDQGDPRPPVWSPDGTFVYFSATGDDGSRDIYRQIADLSTGPVVVLARQGDQVVHAVTEDGELVYTDETHGGANRDRPTGDDIWAVSAEPGGGEPRLLLGGEEHEWSAALSPDGEWLAYNNNRSGEDEVWLRRLDAEGAGRKASTGRGNDAGWTPDGSAICYNDERTLYCVATELGDEVRVLPQEELPFLGSGIQNYWGPAFDSYDDDGRTIFVMSSASSAAVDNDREERIIVVLNWLEMLRRQTSGQ